MDWIIMAASLRKEREKKVIISKFNFTVLIDSLIIVTPTSHHTATSLLTKLTSRGESKASLYRNKLQAPVINTK